MRHRVSEERRQRSRSAFLPGPGESEIAAFVLSLRSAVLGSIPNVAWMEKSAAVTQILLGARFPRDRFPDRRASLHVILADRWQHGGSAIKSSTSKSLSVRSQVRRQLLVAICPSTQGARVERLAAGRSSRIPWRAVRCHRAACQPCFSRTLLLEDEHPDLQLCLCSSSVID